MSNNHRELHIFGAGIHSALAVLHGIGFAYNLRRKNWWQAAIHAVTAAYDIWAVNQHRKEVNDDDEQ